MACGLLFWLLGSYCIAISICFFSGGTQQPSYNWIVIASTLGLQAEGVEIPAGPSVLFHAVGSNKLEHRSRMIYAGFPSFFGLGSRDGGAPTFWLLLQKRAGVAEALANWLASLRGSYHVVVLSFMGGYLPSAPF